MLLIENYYENTESYKNTTKNMYENIQADKNEATMVMLKRMKGNVWATGIQSWKYWSNYRIIFIRKETDVSESFLENKEPVIEELTNKVSN